MKKGFFLLMALLTLFSCRHYEGDGKFIKHSFLGNSYRYVVDFGPISLEQKREYVFHFSGVPSQVDYVLDLDFRIELPQGNNIINFLDTARKKPFSNAVIDLQLTKGKGKTVIGSSGALKEPSWHWSGYQLGPHPGLFSVQISPKQGGDCQFSLYSWKHYTITLKIKEPAPQGAPPCRLLLQGGSWK